MYKCNTCGAFFEEPIVKPMEQETGYQAQLCPNCGSDHFDEANICKSCGEPAISNFCDFCHDKLSYHLEQIQKEMGITYDELQDLIQEHFEW